LDLLPADVDDLLGSALVFRDGHDDDPTLADCSAEAGVFRAQILDSIARRPTGGRLRAICVASWSDRAQPCLAAM
jgi:hypothetical protein